MYIRLKRTPVLERLCDCSSLYKKEITCVTLDGKIFIFFFFLFDFFY